MFAWGREKKGEENDERHLGHDKPRDGDPDPIGNIPGLCRILTVTLFEFLVDLVQ